MATIDDRCAVCGAFSYKQCACPWHLPFNRWPAQLLAQLKAIIPAVPSPGS